MKPRPISSGTRMIPATSGLRPIASIALPTPKPRPIPGPSAPRPMARAGAHASIPCLQSHVGRGTVRALDGFAVLFPVCAVFVGGRDRKEDQRQHREDQGLDDADE